MDVKVLEVLIKRVEKSAQMFVANKNEAWRECLENDKTTLLEYCLKEHNLKSKSLKSFIFNYIHDLDETEYKATLINSEQYDISWKDDDGFKRSTLFSVENVDENLKSGIWKVII